jgi:hypothetical protein
MSTHDAAPEGQDSDPSAGMDRGRYDHIQIIDLANEVRETLAQCNSSVERNSKIVELKAKFSKAGLPSEQLHICFVIADVYVSGAEKGKEEAAAQASKTKVVLFKEYCENHPKLSKLIIVGVVIIALAAVLKALDEIRDILIAAPTEVEQVEKSE